MSDTPRTDAINTYIRTRNDYTKTDHEVWREHARTLETELAAAKKRIADCEARAVANTVAAIIEKNAALRYARNAEYWQSRAEKAEAQLHDLNLDLSTANHMIKLERDRADALQTRLNEIDAMLKSPDLID